MDLLKIEVNAMIKACSDYSFIEINHPLYSPDLAPSCYYLFRNIKRKMRGRQFSSNEEVKDEDQDKEFYFKGISSLKDKWNKCTELVGDYIEK